MRWQGKGVFRRAVRSKLLRHTGVLWQASNGELCTRVCRGSDSVYRIDGKKFLTAKSDEGVTQDNERLRSEGGERRRIHREGLRAGLSLSLRPCKRRDARATKVAMQDSQEEQSRTGLKQMRMLVCRQGEYLVPECKATGTGRLGMVYK